MFKSKLSEYLEKNTKTSNIDLLSDYRIGIEAKPWLLKLPVQEPFQITMGGLPLTLVDTLQKELDKFKKANIKPFFLFNGLSVVKERFNTNPINHRSQKLATAWDAYYRAQYSSAEKCFQESEKNLLLSFIHYIIHYFKQKGIEFFEAPYFAGPQLALFSEPSQKNYLNAVYGSQELLLYGVYRLITDIDYEKGTYSWVDLKSILFELGITHDQFIDACILCGFEYCPTFPPILNPKESFKAACDMVKLYSNGMETIRAFLPMGQVEKYMDQFVRTKSLVHNHLLYYSSNVCEPLSKDFYYRPPFMLNQIFGPRLPNDVYFYISQGVVSPQVINNFISGILAEPFPTIESDEYCIMLDYLKNVRTKTLGLLSICLNDDLKIKPVKTIRWFEPKDFDMPHSTSLNEYHEFTNGYIKVPVEISNQIQTLVKENSNNSNNNSTSSVISFGFVSKNYETLHTSMINSMNDNSQESLLPIRDINEGIFVTLSQTLRMMGYFNNNVNSNDHSKKFLQYAQLFDGISNTKLQEPTLLFIELLRSGSLTFDKLNFVPKPTFNPPSRPSVLLISRVLSLIPSQLDNTPWGGPIDHDLMGFHEITRTLYKSLRNLVEITALSHFLTHRIVLPPPEYFTFSTRLPFFLQPSAALGLLVKCLLLEEMTISKLEDVFPNFTNIKEDLALASQFWDIAFKIVTTLYNDGNTVSKAVYDAFVDADKEWKECIKNIE